jgi:NitT/TauT family transport system permease protein
MGERAKTLLGTLLTLSVLLAGWQVAIVALRLPDYLLPGPAAVAAALWQGWVEGALHLHALYTLAATALGFVAGAAAGLVLGALVAELRPLALAIYPLVIATQSMPTVAIAPLLVVYLGVGLGSKIATVGLLCFFPVFVNTVAGLRAAAPALLDLYRAHGASGWRLFRDVKLPGAVDSIMAGVQVAVVLAFVGCIVSEFVAATHGLGYVIRALASDLNVALMFAAIISLGVLGALAAGLARAAHRWLTPWRQRRA